MCMEIDGHDPDAIDAAITAAKKSDKPIDDRLQDPYRAWAMRRRTPPRATAR